MDWTEELYDQGTQTILGHRPLSPTFDILYGDKIGNPPSPLPPFPDVAESEEEEEEGE